MASASVRIPTKVLIEKLEARLAVLDAGYEEYLAEKEKYEKEANDFRAKAALALLEKIQGIIRDGKFDEISVNHWRGNNVTISATLNDVYPDMPGYRQPTIRKGSREVPEREVIKETLAVLRLTDQETVGASFYNSFTGIL